MAAIDIGHLEGLPQPYSLGDLYTITMVINPPTNWELILQALMLPFFMNRQKYRLTKLRCWKWTNQRVASKRRHFGCFFFDAACKSFLQKKMGQQFYPKNTEKSVLLFRWVFFLCLSRILPQFQCLKQSNKVTYKWGYYKWGYRLYKWPNPTSKCIPIYNQFFVADLVLPMFRPKVWASRFRRMAQVLPNLSEYTWRICSFTSSTW